MLGRLFGSKAANDLIKHADVLFHDGRLGEAKIEYDRLLARVEGKDAAAADHARVRIDACCDGLARARLREADELAKHGAKDLARNELEQAAQVARSSALLTEIEAAQRALEAEEAAAREEQKAPALTREEQHVLIAGSWESLQAEELESYGEPLLDALVALDNGDFDGARSALEALVQSAKAPRYLWLELGRARVAAGADAQAEEALRTFLSRIGPDEGGHARLTAHRELARIAHHRSDIEAAIAELEACAEALEDDPRPYLDLGNYLRVVGRAPEAVEVLELACSMFEGGQVEWPVRMELGLALLDANRFDRARVELGEVARMLASRGEKQLPSELVEALQKLQ